MNIDISQYPIVDNHTHPFPIKRENPSFERYWSISLLPQPVFDTRHTILFQMVMREMANYFGMPKETNPDKIIAHRNQLYKENPKKYVTDLYKAANIEYFLVDFGYPIKGVRLTKAEIDEFENLTSNFKIGNIIRIEYVTDDILEKRLEFSEFTKHYIDTINTAIKERKLIALKTVIAYFTGLGVKKLDERTVRDAYNAYLADSKDRSAEKIIRDYIFFLSVQICLDHKIPMQVHTGFGDSPLCDLRITNPLLFRDALDVEICQKATLIFIHTGYPFVNETGFLVSHYPNLFLDISEMVPFASMGVETKLMEIMEMCPLSKILYGSDGGGIPEHSWYAAIYFRQALERTLNKLIGGGFISETFAIEAAGLILAGNAKRIYSLPK